MTTVHLPTAKRTPSETQAVKNRKPSARSMGAEASRISISPSCSQLAAKLAKASVSERVSLEIRGVPVRLAKELLNCLQIRVSEVDGLFGRARTSLRRRLAASDGHIDGIAGQTIVGCADLLNTLDRLLAEFGSGDRADLADFDAGKWLGQWLREPHPALGGVPPAAYLQAPSGRIAVTRALGAVFSGAYQ